MTFSEKRWFSEPRPTIEEAIQLYQYELFNPAAIFKTPDNTFVLGWLKPQRWSMDFVKDIAAEMKHLISYTMVAYCSPLLNVWRTYPTDEPITQRSRE